MFLCWFLVSTPTELFSQSPKKEVIKKTEIKAVFTRFRLYLQKHTN